MTLSVKARIARAFDRVSAKYDRYADAQALISEELFCFLRNMPELMFSLRPHRTLLDLGCGTGQQSLRAIDYFNPSVAILLDISPKMLAVAQSVTHTLPIEMRYIQGDFERLPLAEKSVDIIFSNLALQWASNLSDALRSASAVLKPGGYFVGSTLLSQTFYELKMASRGIFNTPNEYGNAKHFESGLSEHKLCMLKKQHKRMVTYHKSLNALLHSIKNVGASTSIAGQHRYITRAQHNRLKKNYQVIAENLGLSSLPLTYDAMLFVLQKSEQD